MKNFLFIIGMILLLGNQGIAQLPDKDFVIVGAGSADANLRQVQKRYEKKSDAYFMKETQANPLKQISKAINGRTIRDLHLYLQSKPGALVFNNESVTTEKLNTLKEPLMQWKNFVSGRVVIHSLVVFTGPEGIELKNQLEKSSGLVFVMAR
ncbi:MAG: DUF4347 domain-containing protein [Bacteroidetes bacterium]|nr:DUF4347 domain-containing protein [Bacteroidota bacterium]